MKQEIMTADAYQRLLAQQENERKKPGHEESILQRACVAWFRSAYPEREKILFAVPNGGSRRSREAGIMKAEGVTAGVADLILLEARGGYGSLCIEMKTTRRDSGQGKSQKAWQAVAERYGNKYVVVRTKEQFEAVVSDYLRMPQKCSIFD